MADEWTQPYVKASADIASMYAQLQAKMRGEDVNSINSNYDANKKQMNGDQQAAQGITNQGYASSNSGSAALLASLGIGGLYARKAANSGSLLGHDQDFQNKQMRSRGGASAQWSDDERAASLAYNNRVIDAAGMEGASRQKAIGDSLAAAMAAMASGGSGGGGGGGGGGRGGRGGGYGDDEELQYYHQMTDSEARNAAAGQRRYEVGADRYANAQRALGRNPNSVRDTLSNDPRINSAAINRGNSSKKTSAGKPVSGAVTRRSNKVATKSARRNTGGRF